MVNNISKNLTGVSRGGGEVYLDETHSGEYRLVAHLDKGQSRHHIQDATLIMEMRNGVRTRKLIAVADGVSSRPDGEKAAEKVIVTAEEKANQIIETEHPENVPTEILSEAPVNMYGKMNNDARTTGVVILEDTDKWYGAYTGDSNGRIYSPDGELIYGTVEQGMANLSILGDIWDPNDLDNTVDRATTMLVAYLIDRRDEDTIYDYLMDLKDHGKLKRAHISELISFFVPGAHNILLNAVNPFGFSFDQAYHSEALSNRYFPTKREGVNVETSFKIPEDDLRSVIPFEVEKESGQMAIVCSDGYSKVVTIYETGTQLANTRQNFDDNADALVTLARRRQEALRLQKDQQEQVEVTIGRSHSTGQEFKITIPGTKDHISAAFNKAA